MMRLRFWRSAAVVVVVVTDLVVVVVVDQPRFLQHPTGSRETRAIADNIMIVTGDSFSVDCAHV